MNQMLAIIQCYEIFKLYATESRTEHSPAAGMLPPARRGRRLALPALLSLLTCSLGK